MSNKINEQTTSDDFCFFYDRMDNTNYTIADIVFENYKSSGKQDLRKLVVFCRVKNVVSQEGDSTFTNIGDFGTDFNNLLVADHYVMIVFDFNFQTIFYCDSLGWKAPPDFNDFISSISDSFFNYQKFENIHYAHNSTKSTNIEKHVCESGVCSKYYPLQECGNVCGVSVIITAVIALFDTDIFRKLISTNESGIASLLYLRDISKFSSYYRSVLLKWLVEDISVSDIIPLPVTISQSDNVDSMKHESFNSIQSGAFRNDGFYMIPLNDQNKDILSSGNKLE